MHYPKTNLLTCDNLKSILKFWFCVLIYEKEVWRLLRGDNILFLNFVNSTRNLAVCLKTILLSL